MNIVDVAEQVREIEERRRQAVRDQVINVVLQAPESACVSKREMLGLNKKGRQGPMPLFEERGLF